MMSQTSHFYPSPVTVERIDQKPFLPLHFLELMIQNSFQNTVTKVIQNLIQHILMLCDLKHLKTCLPPSKSDKKENTFASPIT